MREGSAVWRVGRSVGGQRGEEGGGGGGCRSQASPASSHAIRVSTVAAAGGRRHAGAAVGTPPRPPPPRPPTPQRDRAARASHPPHFARCTPPQRERTAVESTAGTANSRSRTTTARQHGWSAARAAPRRYCRRRGAGEAGWDAGRARTTAGGGRRGPWGGGGRTGRGHGHAHALAKARAGAVVVGAGPRRRQSGGGRRPVGGQIATADGTAAACGAAATQVLGYFSTSRTQAYFERINWRTTSESSLIHATDSHT